MKYTVAFLTFVFVTSLLVFTGITRMSNLNDFYEDLFIPDMDIEITTSDEDPFLAPR